MKRKIKAISICLSLLLFCCIANGCSKSSSSGDGSTTTTIASTPNNNAIGYKCVSTDGTGTYYVFINADVVVKTFTSPDDLTGATCVADGASAGIDAITSPTGVSVSGSTVTLQPQTSAIFKKL